MKIIQSFWSRPFFERHQMIQNRIQGGWLDSLSFLGCWALSILQLKKYHYKVSLITDRYGADLLVNRLKFPYDEVLTVYDNMPFLGRNLWAQAKLKAYAIQTMPFLHIDGDVIIFKPFEETLLQSPLVAQSIDVNLEHYHVSMAEVNNYFSYVPEAIVKNYTTDSDLLTSNMGITGGQSLDFFKRYTEEAFRFIAKNEHTLNNINQGKFNMVFEQLLFSCMAKEAGIEVKHYFSKLGISYYELVDYLANYGKENTYFHPVGLFKKDMFINLYVQNLLEETYPDYYTAIEKFVNDHKL